MAINPENTCVIIDLAEYRAAVRDVPDIGRYVTAKDDDPPWLQAMLPLIEAVRGLR